MLNAVSQVLVSIITLSFISSETEHVYIGYWDQASALAQLGMFAPTGLGPA